MEGHCEGCRCPSPDDLLVKDIMDRLLAVGRRLGWSARVVGAVTGKALRLRETRPELVRAWMNYWESQKA